MAIHKLLIDDFVTIDYQLIAIHSSLEDYRLAYFINRELRLLLEKSPHDIPVKTKEGESRMARYVFDNPADDCTWSLIQNKNTITTQKRGAASLFSTEGLTVSTNVFLLPELKMTDYILKIENTPCDFLIGEVSEKLLAIKYIATAYTIDHTKLKSKNNLIF